MVFLVVNYQVGETGTVVGIEHIDKLVTSSVQNLRRMSTLARRLDNGRLKIVVGDGRHGYAESAPYDVIHVGAAPAEIPQAVILMAKLINYCSFNLIVRDQLTHLFNSILRRFSAA